MLKINNISLRPDQPESLLKSKAALRLGVEENDIIRLQITNKSVDARRKTDVHLVYGVCISLRDESGVDTGSADIKRVDAREYCFPFHPASAPTPPVLVVGAGPAGLFAALCLSRAGMRCILIDRGRIVEQRQKDVSAFWQSGALDPESNVQFGEGGAGTFSDGKLTTGIGDARLGFVLSELHAHGAPEDILYLNKPHVGTDKLRNVVRNMREELQRLDCEVRFETKLAGLNIRDGQIVGAYLSDGKTQTLFETAHIVLAPGHSARDTFAMLHETGVPMQSKRFAVGARIEHRQSAITRAQYGIFAGQPALPVPDYKLSAHLPGGRSVFSFCVCPGGTVVAAASEEGCLVTNGMSCYARDEENINGALLVGVGPEDFGNDHPLAGVQYQRELEKRAFAAGGGGFRAPAQRAEDFLLGRKSRGFGEIAPSYRPGVTPASLSDCLPPEIIGAMREALPIFERKIKGFAHPDAVLTGVESRSSSPVRILRGTDGQSAVAGLFPCGEGAGYAGGIMSSAVDGIRAAEAVCRSLGAKNIEG